MADKQTLTDEQLNADKYLRACVNLYGYVTPRQFLKLYNRYNTPKINKADFLLWSEKLQKYSYKYYTVYSNAVVCSRVPKGKIDEILYYQSGKKYYDPTNEELLKYADPNYCEKNEYTENLRNYLLNNMKINVLVAESYISGLVWLMRTEEPIHAENNLAENLGIVPKDINQAGGLFKRIQDLSNNTRKWANCGYTPSELSGEMQIFTR